MGEVCDSSTNVSTIFPCLKIKFDSQVVAKMPSPAENAQAAQNARPLFERARGAMTGVTWPKLQSRDGYLQWYGNMYSNFDCLGISQFVRARVDRLVAGNNNNNWAPAGENDVQREMLRLCFPAIKAGLSGEAMKLTSSQNINSTEDLLASIFRWADPRSSKLHQGLLFDKFRSEIFDRSKTSLDVYRVNISRILVSFVDIIRVASSR